MIRRFFNKLNNEAGTDSDGEADASVTSNNNVSVASRSDVDTSSGTPSAVKSPPAASDQIMDFFHSTIAPTSSASPSKSGHNSLQTINELKSFDVCIEAAEEMASTAMETGRVDKETGLNDCSVLVSADGDLLLIPQTQELRSTQTDGDTGVEVPKRVRMQELLKKTANELGKEYESAVFLGHDVDPIGDESVNGFSTGGWSVPATSLALHQVADTLQDTSDFCEDLIITKKAMAASENQMLYRLRGMVEAPAGDAERQEKHARYLQETFPDSSVEIVPGRVGPLLAAGGSIQTSLVALDNYFTSVAEFESQRWRQLTSATGKMRDIKQRTDKRINDREVTLKSMHQQIKFAEEELLQSKQNAAERWEKVHDTEEKVTQLWENQMSERSKLREQRRLEQLKRDQEERANTSSEENLGATPSEIWDLVNSVTASMEEGSFEPMDLPQLPLSPPQDQSRDMAASNHSLDDLSIDADDTSSHLPKISRLDLEEEQGLPELRADAVSADEATKNSAEKLLKALADQEKGSRSARLAAETCLVDVSNAEVKFLRTIVEAERKSLLERSRLLDELETALGQVDVQEDLRRYINQDKERVGGESSTGNNDDGGISSALHLLHKHLDGDMYEDRKNDMDGEEPESSGDDHGLTRESVEDAIDMFFSENKSLADGAPSDDDVVTAQEEFENTVTQLCKLGKDKAASARPLRSTICYTLNTKRRSHQKIPSNRQFDALSRVFLAVLSGCGTDKSSSSLGRLLMLMSQSIYHQGEGKEISYIKEKLIGHEIWEKDEFWDHALLECVTESVAHSGVLSHFERRGATSSASRKKSEWTEASSHLKWHDLETGERQEAASQVHSVVFLQIGTLAHHMVDLGCGMDRSAAFVRRMSIQNQLPSSQRITLLQQLVFHWKDTQGSSN